MNVLKGAALALVFAGAANAENFTTAEEVRPMLDHTRASWVELVEYDGQDILEFKNLLTWRCGLNAIHYQVNDGAETRWSGEPCYEDEASPNAQKDVNKPSYVGFPLGSVQSVTVRIEYDDGATDSQSYSRGDILAN